MIKVAIVGAGIAGLSAAYHLRKHGVQDIQILEASSTIGGRIQSFREIFTQDIIDNGKHLISGAYTNFFELLDFFETKEKLFSPRNLKIPLISKEKQYHFELGNPKKLKQLQSMFQIGNQNFIDKYNLIKFLFSIKFPKGILHNLFNSIPDKFENFTVEQLLILSRQNKELVEYFWEPLTLATLNAPTNKAPASMLLAVLKKAFFADPNSQKLYFSKVPLSELIKSEEKISFLAQIKTDTKVEKIKPAEHGFNILTSRGITLCDAVIITCSPIFLKTLIDNSKTIELFGNEFYSTISSYKYSTIMSIYFWTEQEFMEEQFAAMIGTKFHWIFRETPNRYTLLMSAANDFAELPKQFLYNLAFAEIEMIFPKFDRTKVTHKLLIKDKCATVEFTPETKRFGQRILRGIYIAGDWTDTGLPATIESAASSGKLAALELINDFF